MSRIASSRPLTALVHRDALAHNLRRVREAAPTARVLAVVKANAYGHGLITVARALVEADGFGVLGLDEAVRLREAGFAHPILLLEGPFAAEDLVEAARLGLAIVVHSEEQLSMLETTPLTRPLDVFLKVNTGMNRLGFAPEAFAAARARLLASQRVGRITCMTHFATADEPAGLGAQFARFRALIGATMPFSAANSAALLRYPETHGDWVRPGIMLYGASPFADVSAAALGLRPAMSLVSRIIAVQRLRRGDAVGYGASFVASDDMRVGIVACGYADGYPRHAGTGTPVLVAGQRSRTVGRVSMDMLCVDLTNLPDAGVGTPVTLWGQGLPVEEVAQAAGTISYELLTGRAERVPLVEA
ncbi:alanine racemase [Thiobacter aerophilum]|uniref:Alanine racemase n=1 Tax=Thiobacter aerophilum TaxID=3121275 RepID=A0ABV0EBI3_9BURK